MLLLFVLFLNNHIFFTFIFLINWFTWVSLFNNEFSPVLYYVSLFLDSSVHELFHLWFNVVMLCFKQCFQFLLSVMVLMVMVLLVSSSLFAVVVDVAAFVVFSHSYIASYVSNGAGNGWVSVAYLDCLSLVAWFRLWVWFWWWWIMLLIHYGFYFLGCFSIWIFQFKTLHLNTFFLF